MRFLDMHGHPAWYIKQDIGMFGNAAATFTGHRDDADAGGTRGLAGGDDIGRIAAGRDADQHVTLAPKRFHLPRENALIPEIIRIGCQEGTVGRQRQRRKTGTGTAMVKRGDEFGGEMLRVGG